MDYFLYQCPITLWYNLEKRITVKTRVEETPVAVWVEYESERKIVGLTLFKLI